MPYTGPRNPQVLSEQQLAAYRRQGWVRLEGAFPRPWALSLQDAIWEELETDHGIRREDPSTWQTPPRAPRRAKESPLNAQLADTPFTGAISDLLGREDWPRPRTWGGFNVFFPRAGDAAWDVPTEIWHWDGPPAGDGLLIFSFYGTVAPEGGGPLIVDGSPRLVDRHYASLSAEDRARPHRFHRKHLSRWDPWLEALTGQRETEGDRRALFMERTTEVQGVPCRVLELTGQPGDAVFCNPGILHCVAPNTSSQPRFMRVKFLLMD